MTFRPELARRILAGHKRVTRRPVSDNPRSPYHPSRIGLMIGKRIAICPGRGKHAIATARVRSVGRHLLEPMALPSAEVVAEGFVSRSEWLGAWAQLHRDLGPVECWRIEFADVEPVNDERRPEAALERRVGKSRADLPSRKLPDAAAVE